MFVRPGDSLVENHGHVRVRALEMLARVAPASTAPESVIVNEEGTIESVEQAVAPFNGRRRELPARGNEPLGQSRLRTPVMVVMRIAVMMAPRI